MAIGSFYMFVVVLNLWSIKPQIPLILNNLTVLSLFFPEHSNTIYYVFTICLIQTNFIDDMSWWHLINISVP